MMRGRTRELCPGSRKYWCFWLRVRQATRESAENCGKQLPRDSAPTSNQSLYEKVAASISLRAVKQQSTVFVKDFLHHKEGATVFKIIP